MKRRRISLSAGIVVLGFLSAAIVWPPLLHPIKLLILGPATVALRVHEYGTAARARLKPFFAAAKFPYPPVRFSLVGLKNERRLELYAAGSNGNFAYVRSYPIVAASGRLGPKLREGDNQVPEGVYRIESLNPNSRYHLALRVDYPNATDRARAKQDGRTALGGDIMIHGSDASIGCLAMGDQAAEDLFVLAADADWSTAEIVLAPVDLRTTGLPPGLKAITSWSPSLYGEIDQALRRYPRADTQSLPN